MSGQGAAIQCDGSCGRVISSGVFSEAELRHILMAEQGWVCDPRGPDGPLDACELEECQDRVVGMVP